MRTDGVRVLVPNNFLTPIYNHNLSTQSKVVNIGYYHHPSPSSDLKSANID
ncbi:Predicted cell-wall-anchored protein SasA (LPXTG motif) [Crocosphaera watsonii WH 0402]|uniref:Predicted cell-wall-anchored protein SasA (LPXTG motif) n=1 Tax=Crocosphaera watsonii WH 0402 TaxID=1284629 RepID=T2JYQ2_CROWT|nr:Predicted cell-wall-anchored protein SasA (LPXTG motif) [Crocosphaera watsonii WH 0402]